MSHWSGTPEMALMQQNPQAYYDACQSGSKVMEYYSVAQGRYISVPITGSLFYTASQLKYSSSK